MVTFNLFPHFFAMFQKMLWKSLMDLFCENSERLIFIKNSVTEAPMTFWILQSCIKKPEPNFKWIENTNCFDIVSYSKISQNIVKWNMKSKVQFLLLPKSVVQIFTPLYDEDRNKELFWPRAVHLTKPKLNKKYRSSHPDVFLRKGVLKICSKVTGEHPCRSVISIKLLCNFIEIALRHRCSPVNLLRIFKTPFPKNISGWLLLKVLKVLWWDFSDYLEFFEPDTCSCITKKKLEQLKRLAVQSIKTFCHSNLEL